MPVSWTLENERKFLLHIINLVSSKDIDAAELATHFPGATPRAIVEHLRVLRKEANALRGAPAVAGLAAPQVRRRGGAQVKEEEEGAGDGEGAGGKQPKKCGRKRKASVGAEGEGNGDAIEVVKKKKGRLSEKDEEAAVKVEDDSDDA
ncbi:MAG: hypothetical protein Q9161_002875 [Pseudevernia consocians]